jgi:hypothetical protein
MAKPKMLSFVWRCSKGHGPVFSYEAETLKGELDDGTLTCFCDTCGEFYLPTEDEKRILRRRIQEVLKNG